MRLPNKPSALIRLALADLAKVEKDKKNYRIDMDKSFHRPNGKCTVCFAGAVMAKSLKVAKEANVIPEDLSGDISPKLNALDSLRVGGILDAFDYLGLELPWGVADHVAVAPYKGDGSKFKADMRRVAKLLESVGE